MLIPLSQKAEASETVSPVVRSLAGRAFIKGVGLSQVRLSQKTACHLQRLLLASLLLLRSSSRRRIAISKRSALEEGFPP